MILRILRENIRTSWVTLLQQKWRRRRPKSVWSGAKPADPSFNRRSWSVFIYVCNTSRGIETTAVALRRHASLSSSRHCVLIHNANDDVLANTVFASPFTTPHPHPASKRRQTLTRFYTFAALVSLARQSQLRSEERPGAVHSDPSTRNVSRGRHSGN